MQIETYSGKYDEIISLILDIQNNESKINLSLEEQPDLLTIHDSYQKNGGEFWIALDQGRVIGTLGLMKKDNHCAIMKKFFVKKEYRSQKVGLAYIRSYSNLQKRQMCSISYWIHRPLHMHHIDFMKRPDRDSILYMLDLGGKASMTE